MGTCLNLQQCAKIGVGIHACKDVRPALRVSKEMYEKLFIKVWTWGVQEEIREHIWGIANASWRRYINDAHLWPPPPQPRTVAVAAFLLNGVDKAEGLHDRMCSLLEDLICAELGVQQDHVLAYVEGYALRVAANWKASRTSFDLV